MSKLYDLLYLDIALRPTGIVLGVLLIALHLFCLFRAESVGAWLKKFPRNKTIGVVILAIDALWCYMIINNMDLGEFFTVRRFVQLAIPLGFWSLLPAHVTFCLPFVVVTVLARLSSFDRALLEAARDLGAGEWAVFRRVILPLSVPAVAAGWLLAFTLSLDDVIVSFFVTGPEYEILPLKIYSMVRLGVKPEVNALAALMFLVPLAAVSAAHILLREKTELVPAPQGWRGSQWLNL